MRWITAICVVGSGIAGCAMPDSESFVRDQAVAAIGPLADAISFQTTGAPDDLEAVLSGVLTLEHAIREALGSSPTIQAALARVRGAAADAKQARLLPNPVVSVALRFPEGGGQPIVEAGLAAELLSMLQQPGRISAADHRLRATSWEALTTILDVLAEVQERYIQAQAMEALTPLLEERRQLLVRTAAHAQARLKAGEGTRLDLTTIEAQRVQIEAEIGELDLERQETRLELARLIGRPSHAPDWKLEPWQPPQSTAAAEAQWIASALDHRPEIQSQVSELAALGVDLKLARWALLDGSTLGVDAEHDGDWSLGPAFSAALPLLDWGQAKRAKVEALRLEAIHELTQIRREVIEDVRRAYAALHSRRTTAAKIGEELVPLLERRRGEAESIYRAGESDVVALILSEQELAAARTKLIDSQFNAIKALFRLQRAAGGTLHSPNGSDSQSTPEVSR